MGNLRGFDKYINIELLKLDSAAESNSKNLQEFLELDSAAESNSRNF